MSCELTPIEDETSDLSVSASSICWFKEKARAFVREKLGHDSENVTQMVVAIGYLESRFGYCKRWLKDGEPTWNWGALIALPGQPTVTVNGAPTMRAFESTDAALRSFWSTWAKPDTLAAAVRGDTFGVSTAMGAHGYYGSASPVDYAKTIQGAARSLYGAETKIRLDLPSAKSSIVMPLLLAGGAALGLWYFSRKVR